MLIIDLIVIAQIVLSHMAISVEGKDVEKCSREGRVNLMIIWLPHILVLDSFICGKSEWMLFSVDLC